MKVNPSRSKPWLLVVLVVVGVVVLYQSFDLGQWLTIEQLKASRDALVGAYATRPVWTLTLFFVVYVLATAVSIPGAVILTLAGGAMFGLGVGLVVVSFASSLGALLAFLMARYVLRDTVQRRFGKFLAPINAGMQRDGVWYLLTLRLVPVFPFWLINLAMGLTTLSASALLCCQPDRHAGRDRCVRKRWHATGRHRFRQRHSLARLVGQSGVAGGVSLGCQIHCQSCAGATHLRALAQAGPIRSQSGRDRRGCWRAGVGLHRSRRQGSGHAD